MKYYLHDTSSYQDEKITELYIKFGYEGLGLFYTLLEKIGQQEKPVKTSVLKHQLNVGKKLDKIWSFMEEIELISSVNGETFNEQILNFSEKYQIKKEKTRKKVAEWREKQVVKKNVTSYETVSNSPKVKLSKINKVKEEVYRKFAHLKLSFEDFDKLNLDYTKEQIDECLDNIENYKKNTSYKSLYLTSKKWLKKDSENTINKPLTLDDQFKHLM